MALDLTGLYISCPRCGESVLASRTYAHFCQIQQFIQPRYSFDIDWSGNGSTMGMIYGNYIVDSREYGGRCLVCNAYVCWASLSKDEHGVCLSCVAHSDVIMRSKQEREKLLDEMTRITLENCIGADWLDKTFGRPPSGNK